MKNKDKQIKLTPHGRSVMEILRGERKEREELRKQGKEVPEKPWYADYLTP